MGNPTKQADQGPQGGNEPFMADAKRIAGIPHVRPVERTLHRIKFGHCFLFLFRSWYDLITQSTSKYGASYMLIRSHMVDIKINGQLEIDFWFCATEQSRSFVPLNQSWWLYNQVATKTCACYSANKNICHARIAQNSHEMEWGNLYPPLLEHSYGKSQFLMRKSTIDSHFQ